MYIEMYKKLRDAWGNMKQRCGNPKHKFYYNYGGRGITVCDRWQKFDNFYEDMFDSLEEALQDNNRKHTTLDRIDNSKGYSKENCRWATPKQQAENRRKNYRIHPRNTIIKDPTRQI